jgi:hypothetical protein
VVRSEGSRSRAAFVAALALHAAAIVLVRRLPLELPLPPVVTSTEPALVWLEQEQAPAAEATPAPGGTATTAGRAPNQRLAALRVERTANPPGSPAALEGTLDEPHADLPAAEPSSDDAESSTPGLTLEQLGIGARNPFLPDAARRIGERPRPGEGLRRSMADAIVRSEQGRGLGPEGPVLKRLVELTRQSDAALDANAVLRVATNAAGQVVSVDVVESTSDMRPWRAVAARLLEALREQRLRVPKGGRGVTMDLRVVSHVELPSGADPGLGVDVLGIPLKRGAGKKSPRISILKIDPKGYKVQLPDGKVLELPSMPLQSLIEVAVDPTDVVGKAQRMVRAHLERVWANELAEETPPATSSSSSLPPARSAAPPPEKPN